MNFRILPVLLAVGITGTQGFSLIPRTGGRDLYVKVESGTVEGKDLVSTDAYVSVSVCDDKERTSVAHLTLHPVWNWEKTFKNVNDKCRLKFHVYDHDIVSDDDMGAFETTVGEWIADRKETSTLHVGDDGPQESKIKVVVKYL